MSANNIGFTPNHSFMTATFYGRVQAYRNENGRVERIDREFDNAHDYEKFVADHPAVLRIGEWPSLGFGFRALPELFRWAERLGFPEAPALAAPRRRPDPARLPAGVDLSEHEKALAEIENDRRQHEEALKEARREHAAKRLDLEAAKERLSHYREAYKAAGKEDLAKKAEADLKKVYAELKLLGDPE